MFRIFAVMVVLALAAVFGRAALMPGDYAVESSIVIDATPKQVMPWLDNFSGWTGWSPLEKQDRGLVKRYSGSASGVGAIYDWSTAGQGGSGRMTVTAAQPDFLRIAIDQHAPVVRASTLEFQLEAVDDTTRVTAKRSGHNDLWTRLRHPLGISTDPIEAQLDDGLTNLKLVVEAS